MSTDTLDRTSAQMSDSASQGTDKSNAFNRFSEPQQAELSLVSEIISGLRDSPNAKGSEFLSLLKSQFGSQIEGLGEELSATAVLREMESKFLIENHSFDARKSRESSVWNLTSLGAVWSVIYEATSKTQQGSTLMIDEDYIFESEQLIDYAQDELVGALAGLRRFNLISSHPSTGFFLVNSPLFDLT